MEASAAGHSAAALELLERAAQEQPLSGAPHFLMGGELASLGEMDQAELCFSRALCLAPDLHVARYQLGLLQLSGGRPSLAVATWEPLLALDESSPLPHFVRGFLALAQDSFDHAQECFEAGMARNLDNPAMTEDIRKVLAAIQARPATEASLASSSDPQEGSSAEHLLLSNYQRGGGFH